MKFAYADPPYFGMGKKMYGSLHPEASRWDDQQSHLELVKTLADEFPDGWALSCNPRDLHWMLPACPSTVRVAAWVKTFHQIRPTPVQYAWEPVIFHGGRTDRKTHGLRDWLACPVRMKSGLQGSKPQPFCTWVLDLLGYDATLDTITELFPGTGLLSSTAQQTRLGIDFT